jgi:hypothetical protein
MVDEGLVCGNSGEPTASSDAETQCLLDNSAKVGELLKSGKRCRIMSIGNGSKELVAKLAKSLGAVEEVEGCQGHGPRGGESTALDEDLSLLNLG